MRRNTGTGTSSRRRNGHAMRAVLFGLLVGVLWSLPQSAAAQCGPGGCVDQAAAEAKLSVMVQNNVFNRHIPPMLGRFEGIGWSKSPGNVPTCVPRQKMVLTADCTRRASNGVWVRIRVWR